MLIFIQFADLGFCEAKKRAKKNEKKFKKFWRYKILLYLCTRNPIERVAGSKHNAEIAQLVEHNLAKVGVASSSLVFRSKSSLRVF